MARKTRPHRRSPTQRKARVGRRSRAGNDWQARSIHQSATPLGPDIVTASLDEVLRAVERAPRGDDWATISRLVIPVLPRVRPHPPGSPPGLRLLLPPGIDVGFGVDIGPAFLSVSAEQVKLLGISEADLVSQALANLLSRAAQVSPATVVRQVIDGLPVVALQTGMSIASALVLAPDEIGRIFGREPRLFIAPMRDALLGFPIEPESELPGLLYGEIASQDPNCLAPIAYRFDGQRVSTASLSAEPPASRRLLA